ncbi:MAG: M23 family metallopeptidase [bacterium]|nr:M23 family metallopeptidase [bacterium]
MKALSLVLLIVLVAGAIFLLKPNPKTSTDEPPLKLKSIGVAFEDFKFTREKLQFNRLFMDYGFFIPASSASPDKKNPQPTFILPLGTKVRSLVDGVVVDIPTLWSGDYSVMVGNGDDRSPWRYETEHVKNVLVKVGDKVSAGQVIAEVSGFDKGAPPGYGAVEIGILKGGNPPQHVCPFAYLDDSIKTETLRKISAFFKSWEEYAGDTTLYTETSIPGCLTLDPIDG